MNYDEVYEELYHDFLALGYNPYKAAELASEEAHERMVRRAEWVRSYNRECG